MAVPLHVKSYYSLGFGTASVEALVDRAAALGFDAMALTDLESLAGQPRFHDRCRARRIRPISGVELRRGFSARHPGERTGRLVLLARSREGYESLCRIVSLRRGGAGTERRQRELRDPVAALLESPRGLMALSDDALVLERVLESGACSAAHAGLLAVRPPAPPARVRRSAAAARRLGVRLVADVDAVMIEARDADLHRLVLAIRAGRRVSELGDAGVESADRLLRGPRELARLFADIPQALESARQVAAECRLTLGGSMPLLPGAEAFGGSTASVQLAKRCRNALAAVRAKGRCRGDAYTRRLDRELDVIARTGYAAYFLAAAEVAEAADHAGVLLAPRGSAVGSLVVHLLKVSPLDPVALGLVFERFLHEERPGPPDIDLDVDSEHREALIGWVRRRFGRDRVTMVGAHHGFRLRGAVREGLKAVGAGDAEVERLLASLPAEAETADQPLPASGLGRAARDWLPVIARLVGMPRSLALHPAGVIVADRDLSRHLPLARSSRGTTVTQYDLRAVEHAGFVKLDLLGSKVLAQLAEAWRTAMPAGPVPADALANAAPSCADVLQPPPDDAATLERLDRADTIGCFQVETPAVRAVLEQLPISSVEDCVAALALVRPGAAAGAAKREYVRRAHGERARSADHPWVAQRLRGTLGLLLYDEDLLRLLSEAAGISLGRADVLRTAIIDAGEDASQGRALEEGFLDLALRSGTPEPAARAVWNMARRFAAYSFSRAHAWSYAVQAYSATYMKTHHTAAFGCALLNDYGGAYPLRTIAADLMRHGVVVLGPSVNHSHARASTESGAVRLGLGHVKRVTAVTLERLLETREREGRFTGMDDFLDRVRPARRETAALVLTGACDGLPPLHEAGYPFVHQALLQGLAGELSPREFEQALARLQWKEAEAPGNSASPDELQQRYRTLVRIKHELDYLEMHVRAHPMAVLRTEAGRHGCSTIAGLKDSPQGSRVRLAGLLAASRRHPIGNGRVLQFLTLEDETGLVESVVPPEHYSRLVSRVTTPGPYLVDGSLHEDHGHRSVSVSDLMPFHERRGSLSS